MNKSQDSIVSIFDFFYRNLNNRNRSNWWRLYILLKESVSLDSYEFAS